MPYVKISGASGTVTGTGGNADFTHSTSSSDASLSAISFSGITDGYWIGDGDSSETHTHVFSDVVGGARLTFNAFDFTESLQIVLDGQVLDLNAAIADGTVSFSGPFDINDNGEVALASGGDGTSTGILAINRPFTTFSVVNAPGSGGTANGIVYDLEVESDPAIVPDFIVEGTAGDDVIDDSYLADPDGDRVDASDAADGSNDDYILAGGGNDSVAAGLGNDLAVGGEGDDTLEGQDGDDTLVGDEEIDSDSSVRGNPVAGPGGADILYGGAGNDSLYGGSGDDSLYGGEGDDSLLGGHGNDLLEGGMGNDDLEGLYGDDTIYGGDGDDHVFGRDGADLIYGGDGVDTLVGSIGIDTLYGGAGNDILAGSQGSDLIYGGEGDDLVYIGAPAPGDIEYDNEGSVYLDEGNDFLDAGDATLKFDAFGGEGNDTMNAGVGDDTLSGGAGDDQIFAGAGDDQLSGDGGDDYIEGQSGDDLFKLEDGFGKDTLVGGETGEVNGDTLDASAVTGDAFLDLSAGDAANPEDGTLSVGIGGGSSAPGVHYVRLFKPDAVVGSRGVYPNTAIDFSAGEWFYVPVADMDSVLHDSQGISGGGGGLDPEQTLLADFDGLSVSGSGLGAPGRSEYLDSDGNPFFAGWVDANYNGATGIPGFTYLIVSDAGGAEPSGVATPTGFEDGNALFSYDSFTPPMDSADFSEIEQVFLGAGNDTVLGSDGADKVFTGAGADVVEGGAGDDVFDIGAGDGAMDTLVLADGSGNDTISGFEAPIDNGDGTYSGEDQLDVSWLHNAIGEPVTVDDVVVTDSNGDGTGDAILTFPNGESITLVGVPVTSLPNAAALQSIGIPGPPQNYIVEGTADADVIDENYFGDPEGDFVDASDNLDWNDDDSIAAGAGDDSIWANLGDDTIDAGDGADVAFGGDGADLVFGGLGNDSLTGDDGNDTLSGDAGDDSLAGGAGDDSLDGGAGDDSFVLEDGFGQDSISGGETAEAAGDHLDAAAVTEGLVLDLTAGDAASGESGTLGDGTNSATFAGIERVTLGSGADSVIGSSGDDTVNTGAGADTVDGGAGNDFFALGADGDADLVRLSDGDGQDTISGFDAPIDNGDGSFTGVDVLDVSGLYSTPGNPVHTGDVVVSDDGAGNTVLTFPNGEAVTLIGLDPQVVANPAYLTALGIPAAPLDAIVEGSAGDDLIDVDYLGDPEGDRIDAGDNLAGNDDDVVVAGDGNDTVYANSGDDSIDGGTGEDELFGGAGNDYIEGAADNDTLDGGTGDDTLLGGEGDDSLEGGAGDDSLLGGAGHDTIFGFEGSDYVEGNDGDDFINTRTSVGTGVPDQGYPGLYPSDTDPLNDRDTVFGGDGNDTILSGDDDDLVYGGIGADSIDAGFDDDTVFGGADADTILGSEGNDSIDGGDGDDVLYGGLEVGTADISSVPDATDLLPANGLDTIHGGAGADLIYGMDDADVLYGGVDNDTVYGGIDNDAVYGGDGDDQLYGDDGDDLVSGEAGNDFLTGGAGGDTVYGGIGADSVEAGEGDDVVFGDDGDDYLDAESGDDYVYGGDGNDVLIGNDGNDTLYGGEGSDFLSGDYDRDVFFGGIGDTIDGGEGGDDFDTLDLSGFTNGVNVIYDPTNAENGTVEVLDALGDVSGSFTFSNIENVINPAVPCFTPGTMILTDMGERLVQDLMVGDKVLTRDNGYQTIRWVGQRVLSRHDLAANATFNPVRIRAGALGNGLPVRDMTVSPQHRMLMSGPRAEMLFGEHEVLVAAQHMVNDRSIVRAWPQNVTYIHILFDQHEIVRGDGSWTESFQPGDHSLLGMGDAQRAEVFALFPALEQGICFPAARLSLKGFETKALLDA